MSKPIFISHAVKDKHLADALVDLLQVGMNLGVDKIFCSSLEGLGIPIGENFVHHIKKQIQQPRAVIALISPNYLASQFCMCELGATWAMSHQLYPLLVPPLKYSDVAGVLTGIQLTVLNDEDKLSEFMDHITSSLCETKVSTARWEVKRDKFVKELPKLLKKLDKPTIVSLAEHTKTQKDLKDAKEALAEVQEEVDNLKSLVEDLSRAKDRGQVAVIKKKHQSAEANLEKFESEVEERLKLLPKSVSYVAFNELGLGNSTLMDVYKDRDFAEQIQDAASKQLVSIDDTGLCSLGEHPKIRSLVAAYEELSDFLSEDCPPEIFEAFEAEHDFPLSLGNRDYWEYALDNRIEKVYA